MTIAGLIDAHVPLQEIAAALEALSPADRVTALQALGRARQRRLFALADPDLDLAHLVPAGQEPLVPVRHAGCNTLPVPRPLKHFAKIFCRPGSGDDRLFGYNESPSRRLLGPGYFVAYSTRAHETWRPRGGVVVDYFQVPDAPVPAGWPRVVPNERGLQFLVYRHTRDFLRRVSAHVAIGAAYRGEKALDHYFTLVRG